MITLLLNSYPLLRCRVFRSGFQEVFNEFMCGCRSSYTIYTSQFAQLRVRFITQWLLASYRHFESEILNEVFGELDHYNNNLRVVQQLGHSLSNLADLYLGAHV